MLVNPSKLLIMVLVTTLTLPVWLGDVAADVQTDLKTTQLRHLRDRIDKITRELESLRNEYDVLQVKLRDSEKQIGALRSSLKQLELQLVVGEQRLAEIGRDKVKQQQALKENAQYLNHQIRVTYMTGKQPYIKMMLNLQDPSKVGRILKYYDYYNLARANRISEIRGDIRKLDSLNRKQERQLQHQNQLKARQEKEKKALEKEQQKRRVLLADLRKQIDNRDKELKVLREDEKRLEKLLNNITSTLSDIESVPQSYRIFAKNKGQMPWPVSGRIIHEFGTQRGQELLWKGVVFQVAPGTQVRAIAHGRVAFSDWLRGYGLLTIIDHGDGYMSLYGNNQALFKSTGDWVAAGEVIAEAGRSDGGTEDSFYFEIRHDGVPINPARWCR